MAMSREEQLAKKREDSRRRYHTDPVYRERLLAHSRERQQRVRADPELSAKRREIVRRSGRKRYKASREEILAALRGRYDTDAEYRELAKVKARERVKCKRADPVARAKINKRQRIRAQKLRATDPDFRRKAIAATVASIKKRRGVDPIYRMRGGIQCTIRQAMVAGRANKSQRTMNYVGCTAKELAAHIERQFQPGMSWKNYGRGPGRWVVDHIRPIASFDLSDAIALAEAFHHTNLQPLWFEDNQRKTSMWNGVQHRRQRAKQDETPR